MIIFFVSIDIDSGGIIHFIINIYSIFLYETNILF